MTDAHGNSDNIRLYLSIDLRRRRATPRHLCSTRFHYYNCSLLESKTAKWCEKCEFKH